MSALRVLAVAMATVMVASVNADDKHMNELKEHYEHVHYIAQFPCHHPQPRVLSVHKLFSSEHTHGKAFFPDVTVLHRCDDETGCCTSDKQCRSQQFNAVELPFKITFLDDTPEHKKGSWIMEYHIVENHTLCSCEVPPPPAHACPNDIQKPSLPGQQGNPQQNEVNVGSALGEEQTNVAAFERQGEEVYYTTTEAPADTW